MQAGGIVFPPMDGAQEAEAVLRTEAEAAARTPAAGDAHYAVGGAWFAAWCQYSGFTYDQGRKRARVVPLDQPGPRPGPIDATELLGEPPVRVRCCAPSAAVSLCS